MGRVPNPIKVYTFILATNCDPEIAILNRP